MVGAYDLVGLDPRGTGGSTRANCGLDEDDREHGVYLGNGNVCGTGKVTEFLTTGARPAEDAYCTD
ncbi:alpha/beta hydrolase [Streptomyces sp. NPDC051664]|uniref:alpha/beta hydrolase n=1 Tax=Streptomyces sp. NPDC051664 TaxID=3365668 RepID=UPI003787B51D